MDVDLLYTASVLVFAAVLAVIVYKDRKNFKRESVFLLRRTQRGKGLITRIGTTVPGFWKVVGFFSVVTGFLVSVLGTKMLADNLMASIAAGSATPGLALLLPSPSPEPAFGYGYFAVPFWYWIICIALLALVHEGFHGIFSAREKVRIKSLGFGLLAIIPLAFVEPDEKQLEKKGMWPALRVFSAGSFANFLLAALSVVIFIGMVGTIYTPSGVDFQTYPFTRISLDAIDDIGGQHVSSASEIPGMLESFGENETVEIRTANGTLYLKRKYFEQQLGRDGRNESIVAFLDYPAAKAGFEGTIVSVDGREIRDPLDLSLALERAGPNRTIEVSVRSGGTVEKYVLETSRAPESSEFSPDVAIHIFAALEHVIPGSIEFYHGSGDALLSLAGQRTGVTWSYAESKVQMWEWVSETYPGLSEAAEGNIMKWEAVRKEHGEPGFIGILNVVPHYELKSGLKDWRAAMDFVQGLLMFLFIINLGVGIVNLLPLKPLDGGKMWDIVLRRYFPESAALLMKLLGLFILALLIANFIPFGAFL
jgi:membrane-associated protease RseP (regulator of RpoE activity)